LERNRDLIAARQRLAEAQGLLRQAGIRLAPTLEITTSTGRPLGTPGESEYSAGYFYPIETGGKRQKRVDVAQLNLGLAEAEVAERSRQLAFEVRRRAGDLFAAQRKQEAVERQLGINRESVRISAVRVEQGDAAPLEHQLLTTELARVEAQSETFRGRAAAAVLEVQQAVGFESPALHFNEAEVAIPPATALKDFQQQALKNRPDLRAARLLEEQGAAEVALAQSQAKPDVTVSARYAHRNSFFDEQFVLSAAGTATQLRDRDNIVTFGVSVPLFTQRRNQGNVEAATARERAARLRREYLEITVPLEVEAAYQRWTAAQRALALYERGVVNQSEKNLAVIRQAYTLGQLRVLDVLAEQRRLIDTQLAYIDAQTELKQAIAELMRAVGGDL
jgi:cobalt-zinc-cadmium efflux system outer membrane protein